MINQLIKEYESVSREAGMMAVLCKKVSENKIGTQEFGKQFTAASGKMYHSLEVANNILKEVLPEGKE